MKIDRGEIEAFRQKAIELKELVLTNPNLSDELKGIVEDWDLTNPFEEKKYYFKQAEPSQYEEEASIMLALCFDQSQYKFDSFFIAWFNEGSKNEYDFKRNDEVGGTYQKGKNYMWVKNDLSLENTLFAVAHEFKHLEQFIEDDNNIELFRELKEAEANLFAEKMLNIYSNYINYMNVPRYTQRPIRI